MSPSQERRNPGASSPRTSIATVSVAILIALALLSFPVLQLCADTPATSVEPVEASDAGQAADAQYSQSIESFKTRSWDWASYADEDGFVNVIVSSSSGSSEALNAFKSWKIEGFSRAFNGFTARVSLDVLAKYSSGQDPAVRVYPDLTLNATMTESVIQVGADQVWSMTDSHGLAVRGTGVVVAIIDTGIDYTHPDLGGGFGPGHKVIGGYDFINGDNDPIDDNGHGTHVAGTVAASGNISGVAPDAKLLAYKCLGRDGSGPMSTAIRGIEAAMDPNGDGDPSDRADVISMSLGGAGDSDDPICQAVKSAIAAGIVVVIAAGNSGSGMGTVASPGVTPEAITVGAVDDNGDLASFSSRGVANSLLIKPEISAPGVAIVSTVPYSGAKYSSPTGYSALSGTSMATPHVSGAVALLLQMHPEWTPSQVKSALISGSSKMNESLWLGGAGGLWAPTAIGQRLFANEPLISYGSAGGASKATTVSNSGASISLTARASDSYSASAEGLRDASYWSNVSTVSPTSFALSSGSSAQVALTVGIPSTSAPEGYYEGWVEITGSGTALRVPFGFVLLSQLTVHVIDANGNEVFDAYGGVYVFDTPGVNITIGVRGGSSPAPPATFRLPSGQYTIHAAGHQLIYTYSDPYVLSASVTVGRLQSQEVTLRMADAKRMTLDLRTDEGKPIYVKDYRVFCRYVGLHNFSFHLVGSDYSVLGSRLFTLPTSRTVYVSDTTSTVGISIAGFSYTSSMWEFMNRNWDHWYEFAGGDTSTDFYIESSADLQYLLAWEFQGVGTSTPTTLTIDPAKASVYDTKYDMSGSLENVWGSWETHLAVGGDSTFYVRRDTDTSLNSFLTGMTRKTIVQGVFSESYYPGNLFQGYFVRGFYTPDYSHRLKADTLSEIYLPDRNFVTPLEGLMTSERIGVGPFYPTLRTANTNNSLVFFYPLLRDQSGAAVGGMYVPTLTLYRNGGLSGIYQLSEYLSRLPAQRIIDLDETGPYTAVIDYQPTPQMCNHVTISLHFTVPSVDLNPPFIRNISLPQYFVPGNSIPVQVRVGDDRSVGTVELSWRTGGSTTWQTLSVTSSGQGAYESNIQTSSSDESVDLKLRVYDTSGNYIEYSAVSVSFKQIPVIFEITTDKTEIGFRNADASIVLTGRLTQTTGEPLHPTSAVPLELMLNGKKLGMILDEYVSSGSHVHNGSIRFEWHFNPYSLFTGVGQTANIQIDFDLGVYQKIIRTISLTSTQYSNILPTISLVSPANNSLIRQGVPIQLDITDDGAFSAQAHLDGASLGQLVSPFKVETTSWSDGSHVLRVSVTDNDSATVQSSYSFSIDAYAPLVQITYPEQGKKVPMNSKLTVSISDSHLATVYYTLDGGAPQSLVSPFEIDMTGWEIGYHTVLINASDLVGRFTLRSVTFEISSGTIALSLDSPQDGSVIKPGVPLSFSAAGPGNMTFRWCENGLWYNLGTQRVISTNGWADGLHVIAINATNDLGGFDEIRIEIIIDGTRPTISLLGRANLTDVNASQILNFSVSDQNFYMVTWTVFGRTWSSINQAFSIYLNPPPQDGYFTVRITAVDKANNTGTATYAFLMDHGPPEISFRNVEPNEAIAPGTDIDVEIQDFFVAYASWTIGSEPMQPLADPYTISTDSFGSGWNYLQIEAMDGCGKTSSKNILLYLDNTAPTVQVRALGTVSKNIPCEVTALIQDDFMVGSAEVFYELSGRSFGSIAMTGLGANYSATIEASELWDGMKLFVRANDTVGNSARSADLVIDVSDAPPGDDDQDGGQGDDSSAFGWLFGSLPGLLTMFAIASSIIIVLFMVTRTRRVKGSGRPSTPHRPSYSATYGASSSAFKVPSSKPRPTPAVQESRPATKTKSVVTQGAVPMTYRASAPVQRSAPVRSATTVVQALPRPPVPRSPAGQDKISRVTPNSPVSDLETLFTPQLMSGLQIKKALDAEKKRQRNYT